MDQLSDVTIYIYADNVLEKWLRSLGSRNMSNEEKHDGHFGKRFDNDHKQRDAQQTRMRD
jgi:urease accessory protein UreE